VTNSVEHGELTLLDHKGVELSKKLINRLDKR
jgi:hypothetical protein